MMGLVDLVLTDRNERGSIPCAWLKKREKKCSRNCLPWIRRLRQNPPMFVLYPSLY